MFAKTPERRMHWIRWALTLGWLLLIISLFYDPISSHHGGSPLESPAH